MQFNLPSTGNRPYLSVVTSLMISLVLLLGVDHISSSVSQAKDLANRNSSIDTGLVGYWKMDERSWIGDCNTKSVLDSSGNNNHAQACPNGSAPQPGPGILGNAAIFDGSNDFLQVTNNASLYGFSAMSVAAWVYLDPTVAVSENPVIIGKANGIGGGYRLQVVN